MAINIFGAKAKFTEEQIIRACIDNGLQDDEGNVFEVITLVSLRPVASGSSTLNFTDTIINAKDQGRITIVNKQRGCGRIAWQRKFGRMIGQLAKTPANIETLAKNYYWKSWKIQEPHIDAEVKALADKYRSEKSEGELAAEFKIIQGSKQSPYGGDMVDAEGKTAEQKEKEIEEANMKKRNAELRNKELELTKKEAKITQTITDKIEAGGSVTEHTYEGLMKMATGPGGLFKLRKLARESFGVELEQTLKKADIVDKILQEQVKRNIKAVKEPVIVTG